jgi:hypothetical protein
LPTLATIEFKNQIKLRKMKEGVLIAITNSYENVEKKRKLVKFIKRRELGEIKKGVSIAIANNCESV